MFFIWFSKSDFPSFMIVKSHRSAISSCGCWQEIHCFAFFMSIPSRCATLCALVSSGATTHIVWSKSIRRLKPLSKSIALSSHSAPDAKKSAATAGCTMSSILCLLCTSFRRNADISSFCNMPSLKMSFPISAERERCNSTDVLMSRLAALSQS